MKLWYKNLEPDKMVERFTAGLDPFLDLRLAEFDCIASQAHARMLWKIGILTSEEMESLVNELDHIKKEINNGKFVIGIDQEDCHTVIENWLTQKCGEAGKKIHTGRSRNDQILTALRLYEKQSLTDLKAVLGKLRETLLMAQDKYKDMPMPGYTHMQRAMPTTVGLWLGSFIESLDDDFILLDAVSSLINKSPLGTAAGFGVPILEIDIEMTSKDLGFLKPMANPIYAQMSRGKLESSILHLLSQVLYTLNKLATDIMLFATYEFGFISLPAQLCTGSSVMPQKKNQDPVELVRAYYHVIVAEEQKVKGIIGNLPSGYNRDLQLTKEPLFKSLDVTFDCVEIMTLIVSQMQLKKNKLTKAISPEMYATQETYTLVKQGVPFREAYQKIGKRYRSKFH